MTTTNQSSKLTENEKTIDDLQRKKQAITEMLTEYEISTELDKNQKPVYIIHVPYTDIPFIINRLMYIFGKTVLQDKEYAAIMHTHGMDINISEIIQTSNYPDISIQSLINSNDTKTNTLHVRCYAEYFYDSQIQVPKKLSLKEAFEYAKDHIDEIPITNPELNPETIELDDEDIDNTMHTYLE